MSYGGANRFYRKPITVSTASDGVSNFQKKITVTYIAGKMAIDFSDLIFQDADGNNLPYWIESQVGGDSAVIWVSLTTSASISSIIYMYYGAKGTVASASNGGDTFLFFDDFPGSSLDASKWTAINSTGFSVGASLLNGSNTTGVLRTNTAMGVGQAFEAKFRYTTLPTNGYMLGGVYVSAADAMGFLNHPGNDYWWLNSGWTAWGTKISASTDYLFYLRAVSTSSATLGIETYPGGVSFETSGAQNFNVTNKYYHLGYRYDAYGAGQAYAGTWDWVRLRKILTTEPTLTFGTEEYLLDNNLILPRKNRYVGSVSNP